jgi:hypothetical protein
MKFMITYSVIPAQQKEATARFLETGGGPPDGVRMLGRWHGSGRGWAVAEAEQISPVYEWILRWNDLLQVVVTPVLEDAEAAEIMKKVNRG